LRKPPAPLLSSVKREALEVPRDDLPDAPVEKAPAKCARAKKEDKEAASSVRSKAGGLEADPAAVGATKRSKKQQPTGPQDKQPRVRQAKQKEAAPEAAASNGEFESLAGFLPTLEVHLKSELPLAIPEEYWEGRLPLPESVASVKEERAEQKEPVLVDLPPIPYSDSGAAYHRILEAQIKDEHSSLRSLSPVSKSWVIHFGEALAKKEPTKKRQREPTKKKDSQKQTETSEKDLLNGLGHDEAALKRMREGWSWWNTPEGWSWRNYGRFHIGVNMIDQLLDKAVPKSKPKPKQRPRSGGARGAAESAEGITERRPRSLE